MRRYVLVPSSSVFLFFLSILISMLFQNGTALTENSSLLLLRFFPRKPNLPFVGWNLHNTLPAHVRTTHESATSPSMPSSSSHSSSCVVEDASDTTDSLRPSFKRLPSRTLGPSNAKRVFLGRGCVVDFDFGRQW
jgi:hypothetical protein